MDKPKAAACPPTNEPSCFTAVKEMQSNMLPRSWEAFPNQETALTRCAVPQTQGADDLHRDAQDYPEERRIWNESKAAMKRLVTKELGKLIDKSLNNIFGTSYHNSQSGVCSFLYNFLEQVTLD